MPAEGFGGGKMPGNAQKSSSSTDLQGPFGCNFIRLRQREWSPAGARRIFSCE
jgi:hypothetical protein